MRTARLGFVVVTTAAVVGYVSGCTCPPPREPEKPAPRESTGPAPAPESQELAGQVATFADEACACEDEACIDAVSAAFNDWAEAHSGAVGSNQAGDEVAAQVARMAACADKFTTKLPLQGQPCTEGGECAEGLECLRYRGIAGDKGPEFSSCEIPCGDGRACPSNMSCQTIADGPGQVCR